MHLITLAALVCRHDLSAQQPPAGGRGRIGGAGIGAYPARAWRPGGHRTRPEHLQHQLRVLPRRRYSRRRHWSSLLRSAVVLDDKSGELIGPVVQAGRPIGACRSSRWPTIRSRTWRRFCTRSPSTATTPRVSAAIHRRRQRHHRGGGIQREMRVVPFDHWRPARSCEQGF